MTTPADLREQIAAEQAEIEECSRLARKMMSTRNPRGRALKGRVSSAQRRIARLEGRLAALDAAAEDVCPIAFDEGPTFYALRVVRHWNGWAVPAMTRRQVEAVVTWEREALADLSGVDHLDLEGDALYLVDASTGKRHEIERGEDGTYVIDVGWTWEQTDL